jgi:hypothetical protein
MNHLSLIAALVLAALLPQSPPQETGLRPGAPPRNPDELKRSLEEQLLGAWQLTGVIHKDVPQANSTFSGYMLVLPDHLSIDMHLVMRSQHPSEQDMPFFQSGVHRWRIAGPMQLETSSLIGTSNVNDLEAWTFEVPNVKRVFSMVLKADTLVLDRKGESRMTFRKIPRMPYPGRTLEFEKERKEGERAAKEKEGVPAEDTTEAGGAKKKDG